MKNGELRIVATIKWSQIFCKALKYYFPHAVSWVLEKATNQSSLKTSKLCYEIDDKIFFKSVKFLSQDFAARQCKLMYRKNSHKTSSRFFCYLYFFIVRSPHWVLDLSLNAQPGGNKFYLLFMYIPHFMMKLCRMCSKYFYNIARVLAPYRTPIERLWTKSLFTHARA